MNKILSVLLITVLLILSIALVSCQEEGPNCNAGHTFVDEVVGSTCEAMGYTIHTCSVCGHSYKTDYTEAHSYVDTVVAPTCDKKGYTKRECSACGDVIHVDFTADFDPNNHVTFTHVKTVESTCTELGYDVEACDGCGYQHKVNYKEFGHKFGDPVVAPVNCGEFGIAVYTCELCGATKEELKDDPKHKLDNFTVDSTTGLMTYYCDCGKSVETTGEYFDVLNLELKTDKDGNKYYVVKGFKEGMKNPTFYAPFSVDNILVTEIAANAFMNYTDLETVRIAVTVTKIGAFAFSGCTGLKTINYDGTMAQWNSINKVDGWNYGAGVFTVVCSDGVITQ